MQYSKNPSLSIFTKARYLRIVFIVDISDTSFNKIYDCVLDFNLSVWGGRFNPIIPMESGVIGEEYWEIIKFCDPDIIYSFTELSTNIVKKIEQNSSPLLITKHKDVSNFHINLPYAPIGIRNLFSMYKRDPLFFYDNPIVPIITDWNFRNSEIGRLLRRNFGIDYDLHSTIHYSSYFNVFEIPMNIEEKELFALFERQNRISFPINFSGYYSYYFMNKNHIQNEAFTIIVGDCPMNWIYNWNRILYLSQFNRNLIFQICLPASFFNDENKIRSLINYLIKSGMLHDQKINFTSFEHNQTTFEDKIRNVLKNKVVYNIISKDLEIRTELEVLEKNFENQNETKHFILDGENKFYFQNPIPSFLSMNTDVNSTFFFDNTWMLDCKVQYRPERFTYTNLDYYWKLPHKIGISRTFFRNFHGRINNDNYFSILVGNKAKNIELTIPSDFNFSWSIIVEENKYLQEDIRKPLPKEISELRISDKGVYALSFLERFPNNCDAARFVETKFWRNLLEHMNKIDEKENQKKIDEVKNRLSKRILPFVENFKNDPDYHINWLTSLILNKSRELKEKREFIKYDELYRWFIKEREDSVKIEKIQNYIPKKEDDENELLEGINRLLEYSIFFQGISPRCTYCGSVFWYSTEEIMDLLICKGCMKKFRLEAETKWSYKLNWGIHFSPAIELLIIS